MSGPVVVQGRPVSAPQQARPANTSTSTAPTNGTTHHGEKQETRCNDIPFAILFYLNVIAIFAVAILTGPDALESNGEDNNSSSNNNNDEDMTREYDGLLYAALICVFLSIFGSLGGVGVMMCIPETLIKAALIFVVILAGIWMVALFLSGSIFAGIIGVMFFAISLCYARAVWPRIPFATANLVTAITAVKANWGVIIYAFVFTALAGAWSLVWSVAFVGVFDKTYECDENNVCTDPNYGFLFLLFVSLFFGHQVLQVSELRL